jgi:acetyl-CoA decarbonylase/synthase complex subunit gamma
MYDRNILTDSQELEIIIPKLSLSGVRLSELRNNKIKPIIGPIYVKNLKQYLQQPPYKDCVEDSVHFGIKSRLYTVVPTMIQSSWYAIIMGFTVFIFNTLFKTGFHWQIMPIVIAISFFYPVLFPWLPGRRFAVKGISLAILLSVYILYTLILKSSSLPLIIFYIAFIFGTNIFFALSYTGNSPVSNYSKVKREIIHFLPLSVIFYAIAIISYFINGSLR